MNRTEFMRELEYLLQDIPEEEKEEALAYYRDYLEDAGDQNEEQVIREFGSPERVAAIIRSDLNGSLEDGGEFTENGYQDERFRDPHYQMVKRKDLPDVHETEPGPAYEGGGAGSANGSFGKGSARTGAAGEERRNARRQDFADRGWLKRLIKVGLLLVVLGVAAPLLLGIGGGILGIMAGVLCLAIGVIICIGVLTIVACIGSVALLVVGGGMLLANPAAGVLMLGIGIFVLGLALLGIAISVLVYGKLIPGCVRAVVNTLSDLLHRGRRNRT